MQISNQVIEILDYLCEKLGVTVDWTSENVLPYLAELCGKYVRYEIATSIVWIVVGIVLTVISCVLLKKAVAEIKKDIYYFNEECWEFAAALCIVCIIASFIIIICQVFDIVECCTIPEKVIFEYVQMAIK